MIPTCILSAAALSRLEALSLYTTFPTVFSYPSTPARESLILAPSGLRTFLNQRKDEICMYFLSVCSLATPIVVVAFLCGVLTRTFHSSFFFNRLKRLEYAFSHGLTFSVGTSLTTGQDNTVIWGSIHHKTSTTPGPHGFPDPNFFANWYVRGLNSRSLICQFCCFLYA